MKGSIMSRIGGHIVPALCILVAMTSNAATEDLGNGFHHHGVATPVSNHRGTVVTVDGDGRNVVLVWLYDHRGGYALLMIDAETGKSQSIPMPFPIGGDCPFASILSSGNKFYTHFNGYFCEFDPAKRAFTFHHKTRKRVAMGMTEDDNGVIWAATYPNSGVISFDPKTREFNDFGYVHQENWKQYQRYIATDDTGYVYFGIGNTASHIIGFDPATGKAKPLTPEDERAQGSGYVHRAVDGKVYGQPNPKGPWYVFYQGAATKLEKKPTVAKKPYIASHQGLFHREFPDGKRMNVCNLVTRTLTVHDPAAKKNARVKFDYESEGAHVMGMAAAPDGTICGGTAFPMRFFSYNPKTDKWTNREAHGQWNTVARQGDRFFAGGYGGGFLLEWDPASKWVKTVKGKADSNPLFHMECRPDINRPHDLLAHPDGNTLVLAGTPGYGFTGGGLLFWDRAKSQGTLIKHTQLLEQQSTMSLAALPEGKIIGGTTIEAGTGGEVKAKQAELYVIDKDSKKIEWRDPVFPGVRTYGDLCTAANGLVYGFADQVRFFVFDPATRKIVHEQNTKDAFGPTNWQQGPRTFVTADDGAIYILFVKGIATLDQSTHEITLLAKSPVKIGPGGDWLDGRIYFGSGSHVYSYAPQPQ